MHKTLTQAYITTCMDLHMTCFGGSFMQVTIETAYHKQQPRYCCNQVKLTWTNIPTFTVNLLIGPGMTLCIGYEVQRALQ